MLRSNKGGADLARSSKRNGRTDDLTRNSKKNKKTYFTSSATKRKICTGGEPTELSTSGDLHRNSNQGAWSELSEEVASRLSKSVVILALSDGHKVLFASSGVAVERLGHVTRVVTSASLVKALNDQRKEHDELKVLVRHEDNVVIGFLEKYDLDLNIAAVNVMDLPDLQAILFNYSVKSLPHSTVLAVGRDMCGKLMSTFGILNGVSRGSGYSERFMLSTCKISEDLQGGPLFACDGNFVGMNLFFSTEGTYFLPMIIVIGWFASCKPLERIKFPAPLNSFKAAVRVGERLSGEIPNSDEEVHRDVLNKDQFGDLESLGYPEPLKSMLNDGMILVSTFEEPFGDVCGKGVWNELSETASAFIQRNIVALASFSGEKRFFACTGLFIEWNGCTAILTSASLLRNSSLGNKIIENLRIEVLLPNKLRVEGTLEHYNLHYNVALVSVKDFCVDQPAKVQQLCFGACELLAVWCCFKSGRLMAARGRQFARPVERGYNFLGYSTCKISKAGIGGPLLDFDGNFVGMNFYDKVGGTPHVSWMHILPVLQYFTTKGAVAVAEVGGDGNPSCVLDWTKDGDRRVSSNRWPVAMPYWCHPDDLDKHEYEMPYWCHPTDLAASAIFLSKFILKPTKHPWNSTLAHYTQYRPSELCDCVKALHRLFSVGPASNLPAIREKYSQHKYKFVAKKHCPPSVPTEFLRDPKC